MGRTASLCLAFNIQQISQNLTFIAAYSISSRSKPPTCYLNTVNSADFLHLLIMEELALMQWLWISRLVAIQTEQGGLVLEGGRVGFRVDFGCCSRNPTIHTIYQMKTLFGGGLLKYLKKYNELTKFKLSLLNGIVTVASYSMYATACSPLPLFLSSVALSMSTQSLNQYIEVEYDKKMVRTSQRPLVLGTPPKYALYNGILLGGLGMLGLYSYNPMTAAIGAAIWGGYLFIYTKMKSKSEWNTMVGSVVGSLPVYLGWVASGRSFCMVEPFAMFLYIMAWQHQHFYGIRWIYYDDYNNAGFRMEKSKQIAAAQVIFQTALTLVFANYALKYYHIPHCWILNGVLSGGLYAWGIRPSFLFAEGKITPKQLKMDSYKHFCLVFGIFMLCSVFGTPQDAQEIKQRKYCREEEGWLRFDTFY